MKRILLISDTHSHLDVNLLKYIEDSDEVWHAGDIGSYELCTEIGQKTKFRAVYGNIDDHKMRVSYPEYDSFSCEKVKVLMTHIGGNPPKYNANSFEKIRQVKPNIFICGHSHILKVMYDKSNELLFMNPGACGVHGFHQVKTALRFEIDQAEIKNLEIIELGKRSDKIA